MTNSCFPTFIILRHRNQSNLFTIYITFQSIKITKRSQYNKSEMRQIKKIKL